MNPLKTSIALLQAARRRGRPQEMLKWTILKVAEKCSKT
jgi:hypothetical protein